MERDAQGYKVYAAQKHLPEYAEQAFSLRGAQLFANEVVAGPVWKEISPSASGVVIKINKAHNAKYSFAEWNGDIIKLHPSHGMNAMTILHEMAHTLVIRRWYRKAAHHGPDWAAIFTKLIETHAAGLLDRWLEAAEAEGVNLVPTRTLQLL